MSPDRTSGLAAAAARRRSAALERAQTALHDLDARGEVVSFQAVARAAAVSRQWLYQQAELRAAIERLRDRRRQTPAQPARERASDASWRQRIETLLEQNRRLQAENRELRTELALAYGQQCDAATGPLEPR